MVCAKTQTEVGRKLLFRAGALDGPYKLLPQTSVRGISGLLKLDGHLGMCGRWKMSRHSVQRGKIHNSCGERCCARRETVCLFLSYL